MTKSDVRRDSRKVLGVWDLAAAPLSLGGLIIFVEELLTAAENENMSGDIDIVFVGELALRNVLDKRVSGETVMTLSSEDCRDSALNVLFALSPVDRVMWSDRASLEKIAAESGHVFYAVRQDQPQGSTEFIQEYFQTEGCIPHLTCSAEGRHAAWAFYRELVAPALPVVVHLKNNPGRPGESNADLPVWRSFFAAAQYREDVRFILIGNEDPGEGFRDLPNVVVAADYENDLARDLALVEMAFLFLGMASGPCNFAIFSDVPYVIYKNPDHHAAEMKKELGESDRFPFARPFQKFLRARETQEGLVNGWESFMFYLRIEDWQARAGRIHKNVKIFKTMNRKRRFER